MGEFLPIRTNRCASGAVGPTVGVDHIGVHPLGRREGRAVDPFDRVGAEMTGWSRATLPVAVPAVERRGAVSAAWNQYSGATISASRSTAPTVCSTARRRARVALASSSRAVTHAGRIGGAAFVEGLVEDGARDLGVVGPRPAVEVVGADREPDVVDDADLGVHVDRCPVLVLEVVDRDAVAAARRRTSSCTCWRPMVLAAPETRPPGRDSAAPTAITSSSGSRRSASASVSAACERPQVLVLEVDEPRAPARTP